MADRYPESTLTFLVSLPMDSERGISPFYFPRNKSIRHATDSRTTIALDRGSQKSKFTHLTQDLGVEILLDAD